MRAVRESEVRNAAVFAFGDALLEWYPLDDGEKHIGGHADLGALRWLENADRFHTLWRQDQEESLESPIQLDQRRHRGKVNIVCGDGHVEQHRALDLSEPKMRSRWDRNGDPHIGP